LGIIDLNLYNLNFLPFKPTLSGISAKIGPEGVSTFISNAVIQQIGKKNSPKNNAKKISMVRFNRL
jgi:hypothetical protein